jgi:MAF protein
MSATPSNRPRLVLASTSPFRRELLARLGLPFETAAPGVDETRRDGEAPRALVERLAEAKARAVAARFADAVIIGSDQVACIDGEILGKPGGRARAIAQLERCAGREVRFETGVCVHRAAEDRAEVFCEPYRVRFRPLSSAEISAYVDRARPYGCAGSIRSEDLGIALFEHMRGDDPTALIGLPLIRLSRALAGAGLDPLAPLPADAQPGG